jgi:hypothetical protein
MGFAPESISGRESIMIGSVCKEGDFAVVLPYALMDAMTVQQIAFQILASIVYQTVSAMQARLGRADMHADYAPLENTKIA